MTRDVLSIGYCNTLANLVKHCLRIYIIAPEIPLLSLPVSLCLSLPFPLCLCDHEYCVSYGRGRRRHRLCLSDSLALSLCLRENVFCNLRLSHLRSSENDEYSGLFALWRLIPAVCLIFVLVKVTSTIHTATVLISVLVSHRYCNLHLSHLCPCESYEYSCL